MNVTSISRVLVASLLLSLAVVTHTTAKRNEHDPIVGSWVYNMFVFEDTLYGVATFHNDGTISFHDSGNLTQALTLTPEGLLMTKSTGTWEKEDKGLYTLVYTTVVLARDPSNPAAPALPLFRFKAVERLNLDKCTETASSSATLTIHPVNDLTVSLPVDPPADPIPYTRLYRKFN